MVAALALWLVSAATAGAADLPKDGVEFLASTDAWFRPVNLYIGPDGAMYLMDYYRMIIEHPEWMATKHQHSPDLFKGIDRGRIYRIVPDGAGGPVKGIHLPDSNQELVKMLENPIIWWRRTAQRLLVDRRAVDVTADLVRLFQQSSSPQARVHALWTLEGIGKLVLFFKGALVHRAQHGDESCAELIEVFEIRAKIEADVIQQPLDALGVFSRHRFAVFKSGHLPLRLNAEMSHNQTDAVRLRERPPAQAGHL